MSAPFQRDGRPWDSEARLRRALEVIGAAPPPRSVRSRPPGPAPGDPLLYEMVTTGLRPWMFDQIREEYPDLAYLEILRGGADSHGASIPTYVVMAPSLVEQVWHHQSRQVGRSLATTMFKVLLGEGLLTVGDPEHTAHRRVIQPAFAAPRRGEVLAPTVETTKAWVRRWEDGRAYDLDAQMRELTLVAVTRFLLGSGTTDLALEFGRLQRHFIEEVLPNLLLPGGAQEALTPGTDLHARLIACDGLDRLMADLIRQRRSAGTGDGSLLSTLLRDDSFDDAQVRDEMFTMTLAGSESVGRHATFAVLLLARDPDLQEQVAGEVDRVIGDRDPTVTDCDSLPLTGAVVLEALRLFPPEVWVLQRTAESDLTAGDYVIPAGATFLTPLWVIHRDPRSWADAEEFQPRRWLDEDGRLDERAPGQPPGAWLPFGMGSRRCPAIHQVPLEVTAILAVILRGWRLAAVTPGPVTTHAAVAITAADPWVTVYRRERQSMAE